MLMQKLVNYPKYIRNIVVTIINIKNYNTVKMVEASISKLHKTK